MRTLVVAVVVSLSACNCASSSGAEKPVNLLEVGFNVPPGFTEAGIDPAKILWTCAFVDLDTGQWSDEFHCIPQADYEAAKTKVGGGSDVNTEM